MSRLGRTPIQLPKGVEVTVKDGKVQIKGPKGTLINEIPSAIKLQIGEGDVKVDMEEGKLPKPMHGLHRNLIKNSIVGVSDGYEKRLSLIGVGFRAALKGEQLDLQLGFSHPSQVQIPSGINVKIDKGTTIIISGIDKQLVGQFAATVRALRPPEPYKGKGVRYENEYVRKKEGKTAKTK